MRNETDLVCLNDLVYIKYNRTLKRSSYGARDIINPILLDNIDEINKWLDEAPKNHENELVYERVISITTMFGIEENIYGLRGSSVT